VQGFLPRAWDHPVASYGTTCLMPGTNASRSPDLGGSGMAFREVAVRFSEGFPVHTRPSQCAGAGQMTWQGTSTVVPMHPQLLLAER
jgi:hypothetical protein